MKIERPFFTTAILVSIFLSHFTSAQTDYAIRLNGDTIKGSLKILDYMQVDRIQIKTDNEKTVLTALQIRSLKKDNILYRPVRIDNTVRFMKVLIDGYLSLNAFKPQNQGSWDGRYLIKMDGTGMEVPNLTFKKSLSNYLSDCGDINTQITKGALGKSDLEKIVDLYNACMQAKTVVNSTTPPPANIESEKVLAVKNLLAKVETENFTTKKDALDILKDIQTKVIKNEPVPNYLIDGLKSSLAETPALTKDLDNVITLLKK